MRDPILITGCARSGTSMVAGAIHLCGAFGGELAGPNKNNRKGMFENSAIRETLSKPYMARNGADRLGQYPLPEIDKLNIPLNWRNRVLDIMRSQGYKKGPWFYKGAKMCLTWPLWHSAFPEARWIIVRRDAQDIVNSCMKTSFMRAYHRREVLQAIGEDNEADGWHWWVRQHEKRFVEMISAGLNCQMLWPSRMVIGDYRHMMSVVEWAGLKWNSEVLSFIDPKLWHSRNRRND